MKLVLAYDGSDCSEAALQNLSRAALPAAGEALVVSAADVILPVGFAGPEETGLLVSPEAVKRAWVFVQEAVKMAEATAENGAKKLRVILPGWDVRAVGVGDSPAWAVLKEAQEYGADLIVAGSHGKGLMRRVFLGSVSHRILHEAHCQVRIARPVAEGDVVRVMVALDGSPSSAGVLKAVQQRTWPAGTEFFLVTVVDSQIMSAVATAPYGGIWYLPENSEVKEAGQRMIEGFAQPLREAGFSVKVSVREGDPKEEIVSEADRLGVETIFLGAQGLHHGTKRPLGTVAGVVAARAHCPVEVVRVSS